MGSIPSFASSGKSAGKKSSTAPSRVRSADTSSTISAAYSYRSDTATISAASFTSRGTRGSSYAESHSTTTTAPQSSRRSTTLRGSSSAESRSSKAPPSSTALPPIPESIPAGGNSAVHKKPVMRQHDVRPSAHPPSLGFPSRARVIDQNQWGALAANDPLRWISSASPGYYAASPGWTNGVGGACVSVTYSDPYLHAPYNYFTASILGAHAPNPTPAGGAYPFNLQTPGYSSAYPGAPLGGYATNIQTNSATAGRCVRWLESAAGTNSETHAYNSAYPGASGHATNIWANGATAGRWARGTNFEAAPSAQALPTENEVLVPQAPNQQNHTTQGMQGNTQSVNPTMPEPIGQQFVPPQDGSKPSNIINRLLCVVIVMLSIIIFRLM